MARKKAVVEQVEPQAQLTPEQEYDKRMTEMYAAYDPTMLDVERGRLFDIIRTRASDATWQVKARYQIVCDMLHKLGK